MSTDAALSQYLDFLRFGSISTDAKYKDQVNACADWLVAKLKAIGLDTHLHPTPGHPVIVAHGPKKEGRPTVLIYGHYDVQPVDPLDLWKRPPFNPGVENGIVTARGASDNKGQIFAHILGLEHTLKETGDLPANVIVLVEGEEEIGSPNLAPFLESHRDELACDVVIISDSSMVAPGVPTFTYGLRGIAALEVTLTGPDHDLHSGIFGGAVENPVTVLARLIAGLHDKSLKVKLDGFYDDVKPLATWERRAWKRLPLTEVELLKMTGAPALRGEKGFSPIERIWARPTAEVNGFGGGYQGEGTKTVLPSKAVAKFTFRLVPGQDPAKIVAIVEDYFRKNVPPSVHMRLVPGHAGEPYLVDPHAGFGAAAQKALGRLFPGKKPALIREGGSIPIVADFKHILNADTLLLGLALADCNAHSPNETFPVAHLDLGARLNRYVLEEIAAAKG
ncbi:MAG TPA: dipeptidase [Candidatus Methylacidiphilales bacterium]|jgi:acetylornithine deacetylase/succinyl-diaminopimelate desuccinylase-like protein|nr:dipeptidase [Candidatus Methylacidiphilales bacterium]